MNTYYKFLAILVVLHTLTYEVYTMNKGSSNAGNETTDNNEETPKLPQMGAPIRLRAQGMGASGMEEMRALGLEGFRGRRMGVLRMEEPTTSETRGTLPETKEECLEQLKNEGFDFTKDGTSNFGNGPDINIVFQNFIDLNFHALGNNFGVTHIPTEFSYLYKFYLHIMITIFEPTSIYLPYGPEGFCENYNSYFANHYLQEWNRGILREGNNDQHQQ